MIDNLKITEGISGYWFYHFSHPETITKSLCGKQTMRTAMPLSSWGAIGHLRERYCKECEKLALEVEP